MSPANSHPGKRWAYFDRSSLARIFSRLSNLCVWVVGDIMLDEYATGEVDRISPEAPVPVIRVRQIEGRLGGAANVARQIAILGGSVTLAGLVGADAAGKAILSLCAESGIDTRAVRQLPLRRTTRKLRGIARNQQLLRLDWEDTAPSGTEDVDWIIDRLQGGPAPDIVIASDYAKGVLTPELLARITRCATAAGADVVVDPKRRDFDIYRGASIVTPNLHEFEIAAGKQFAPDDTESIAACAQSLAVHIGADALVVTRGERGMLVAPAHGKDHYVIPARGRSLFDTTGAGDTVVAVLSATLAAGATLEEAAQIANAAAGIAVGRVGVVSVTASEINECLCGEAARKVLDLSELTTKVEQWRGAGKRIVFTNGCFDLLHAGHLSLLHQAADHGDVLILAVNSDASVRQIKGSKRPLISERERAAMLAALECVDAVTVFEEETPLEALRAIRPDVLVKGQDYKLEQVVGRELVESYGGSVVLVPLVPGRSTTALIDRIANSTH